MRETLIQDNGNSTHSQFYSTKTHTYIKKSMFIASAYTLP